MFYTGYGQNETKIRAPTTKTWPELQYFVRLASIHETSCWVQVRKVKNKK